MTSGKGLTSLVSEEGSNEGSSEDGNFVEERCGYCSKKLEIPVEIYKKLEQRALKKDRTLELNRYDGFFVSSYGHYYCDFDHYNLFTED